MCTCFSHALVAGVAGKMIFPGPMPKHFLPIAMICSAAPDLDYGLHHYGVEYGDLWGHRGMTHSIPFAFVAAALVVTLCFRRYAGRDVRRWLSLHAFFTVIIASHGVIDGFTNGGLGIAYFSPFDTTRYFMPYTPIEVSDLGLRNVFTARFVQVMLSEFLWVWLPTLVILAPLCALRMWWRRRTTVDAQPTT